MQQAELEKELFIVLLVQGEVLEKGRKIQKIIDDYYNLYRDGNYPELHITIDRIDRKYAKQAGDILRKVVSEIEPVEIELTSFTCYRQIDNRFLVMKVKENRTMLNFANRVHGLLEKEGISTISNYRDWEFHITILSNVFTDEKIPDIDFKKICTYMEGTEAFCKSCADKLEIWSPLLEAEEKRLYSIKLPE